MADRFDEGSVLAVPQQGLRRGNPAPDEPSARVRTTRFRRLVLAGALVAGLTQGCIDIPVSGSGLRQDPYYDERRYPYGQRRYPEDDYGGYPEVEREHDHYPCSKVDERIRYDRQKIATIDPSEHHKALQWYKDDLQNALRDKEHCRREEHGREWESERAHRREEERRRDREAERARERERDQARAQAECQKNRERIRYDQQKLAQIPPEQHKKAAQWYRDDIRNAERDLQRGGCR